MYFSYIELCAIKLKRMFVFPDPVIPIIRAFLGWFKQKTLFVIVLNFYQLFHQN